VLVTLYIDPIPADHPEPFDGIRLLLAGLGVAGLAFGLSVAGLDMLPWQAIVALIGGGAIAMAAYLMHARKIPAPVLDFSLLRYATFRASLIGGFMFRIGVGALPFLLPLMLQAGFGFTPFQSGLVTFAGAIGAIGMKTVAARTIERYGFKRVLVVNALASSLFIAACAIYQPGMPAAILTAILLVGGFFRALQFTAVNTIAYAEIDQRQMSRATALAAVGQQLSLSMGVAIGALAVDLSMDWSGSNTLSPSHFTAAFLVVAAIAASSTVIFRRLPADAGAEMSGRKPAEPTPTKAEPIAAGETSDQRIG